MTKPHLALPKPFFLEQSHSTQASRKSPPTPAAHVNLIRHMVIFVFNKQGKYRATGRICPGPPVVHDVDLDCNGQVNGTSRKFPEVHRASSRPYLTPLAPEVLEAHIEVSLGVPFRKSSHRRWCRDRPRPPGLSYLGHSSRRHELGFDRPYPLFDNNSRILTELKHRLVHVFDVGTKSRHDGKGCNGFLN